MTNFLLNSPPLKTPIQDANGNIDASWQDFCSAVFFSIISLQTSGTTANRPTKNLWIGRPYFDTSLGAAGKPIWYGSNGTWRLADGTAA